jgi:hypothetical protein
MNDPHTEQDAARAREQAALWIAGRQWLAVNRWKLYAAGLAAFAAGFAFGVYY